ncbi:MAG: hypothetical protein K2Y08_07320 [Alphaproteobacteria bacterium]|nr:hypothetical protein [Alphaproteobacteria bacterium]
MYKKIFQTSATLLGFKFKSSHKNKPEDTMDRFEQASWCATEVTQGKGGGGAEQPFPTYHPHNH